MGKQGDLQFIAMLKIKLLTLVFLIHQVQFTFADKIYDCQEVQGKTCFIGQYCGEGGYCPVFFGLSQIGKCACKAQPTPKPPKQCKELEGTYCGNDWECGKGGYCSRDRPGKYGECKCWNCHPYCKMSGSL